MVQQSQTEITKPTPQPQPETTVKKRVPFFRWKAIYILLGLIAFFGIIGYFFLDQIVTWSIVRSLETIVGAEVDATKVHFDFNRFAVSIENLQITNPKNTWRNLLEAQNVNFRVEPEPLFEGKTVIDEIIVDELMINTKRKTDGTLHRPLLPGPFGEAQAKLNRDIADMPILDPSHFSGAMDLNKIMSGYQFQTDLSALDIKARIEDARKNWHTSVTDLEGIKPKIQDIHNQINEFNKINPKSLPELNEKINKIKDIQKAITQLQDQITKTRTGFKTTFDGISGEITALKKIADGDYRSLLKLAKVPNYENVNITEALVGKSLLDESTVFLNLIDKIQKMMPVNIVSTPKEEHPRGGQNIVFPAPKHAVYPRFLIKHIQVSGRGTPSSKMDGYYARATVDGVTTQPQVYGKPMLVTLYGQARNKAYLDLNGSLNHINSYYHDFINFKVGNIPLPDMKLSSNTKNQYLPSRLLTGNAEVTSKLEVQPQVFRLDMVINGHDLVGDYTGKPLPKNLIAEMLRDIFSKIDLLTINYHLEGDHKKLKMKVSSNFDDILASRIKSFIRGKIQGFIQKIRDRVDAKLKEKQLELEAKRKAYQDELQARITKVQDQLDQERKALDQKKKELDDKIAKLKADQTKSLQNIPNLPQLPKIDTSKLKLPR